VFPLLATLVFVGYNFRGEGVPLFIFGFDKRVDVFGFFFTNEAPSWTTVVLENYALWFCLYMLSEILLYTHPLKLLFSKNKFNPSDPPMNLVVVEFLRSARGIAICSMFEVFVNWLVLDGYVQWNVPGFDSMWNVLVGSLLLYIWSDAHFYWTHRMLHTRWLYKTVHKYHHESFNPDPFSGLSMHWFESCVYFSSALILGLCGCPAWLVRLNFKGLIIFPLEGHAGFGSWSVESSHNHYLHHAKFNWNYGSSPLWDHLMNTNYKHYDQLGKGSSSGSSSSQLSAEDIEREKEALEQAKLVQCRMDSRNMQGVSTSAAEGTKYQ